MTRIGINARPIPALSGPGGLGGQNDVPSGVEALCDIIDVDCTYLAEGDVLVWTGYVWEAQAPTTSGRWELAVIPGSPPDPLYADGDFLYIFVP